MSNRSEPNGNVFPLHSSNVASISGTPNKKRILLLQGPIGPFFHLLQEKLNSHGFDTWRATFNAADRLYADQNKVFSYKGSPENLGDWFENLLFSTEFDAVILFGCMRPIHQVARNICKDLGVLVISLEEGYIRPGYVTVEIGGNNSESPLAGNMPSEIGFKNQTGDKDLPVSSPFNMGFYATVYFIIHGLFSSRNEKALFHKKSRTNLIYEFFAWNRNGVTKISHQKRNSQVLERLLERYERRYFIVPFQVTDDSQLTSSAGRGWTNETLAMKVIESFAKKCSSKYRLVFKIHPLERGHTSLPALVERLAQLSGISDRVDIIDGGSLGLLTRHSAGMVTINSTAGFSAIYHGTPLAVLGSAIYGNSKLVHVVKDNDGIDRFWIKRVVASAKQRKNFLSWITKEALVPGDYYSKEEQDISSENVANKCINLIEKHLVSRDNLVVFVNKNAVL